MRKPTHYRLITDTCPGSPPAGAAGGRSTAEQPPAGRKAPPAKRQGAPPRAVDPRGQETICTTVLTPPHWRGPKLFMQRNFPSASRLLAALVNFADHHIPPRPAPAAAHLELVGGWTKTGTCSPEVPA